MAINDGHIDIKKYYNAVDKSTERKEAQVYFNDKYFKQPFDNYFIIEEESRFIARKIKFFLPGSIYFFRYPNPITEDILSFFDKRPMILVIGTFDSKTTKRKILQGINLNFIPEVQKVQLLDTYYRAFNQYLLQAERDSDKGLIGQSKNLAKFLTDWSLMTQIFINQGKIPLSFCIRNYDITRILNPVLVEMEDWPEVPFYVPREFKGKAPAQVWADYITAKKQTVSARKTVDPKRNEANKKRFKS